MKCSIQMLGVLAEIKWNSSMWWEFYSVAFSSSLIPSPFSESRLWVWLKNWFPDSTCEARSGFLFCNPEGKTMLNIVRNTTVGVLLLSSIPRPRGEEEAGLQHGSGKEWVHSIPGKHSPWPLGRRALRVLEPSHPPWTPAHVMESGEGHWASVGGGLSQFLLREPKWQPQASRTRANNLCISFVSLIIMVTTLHKFMGTGIHRNRNK